LYYIVRVKGLTSTTDLAKKTGNPENKKMYFDGLYELLKGTN
jgi:hypothetical protein